VTPLITIAACAVLNRARGDDRWMRHGFDHRAAKRIPGRALWYVSPAFGCAALFCGHGLVAAALWSLTVLVWGAGPWGYLIYVARPSNGKTPTRLERFLLDATGGNVHLALFCRMCFCLPGFMALAWWHGAFWLVALAPAFAALATAAYEAAWRIRPSNPIWIAELIVGALWGVLITATGGAS